MAMNAKTGSPALIRRKDVPLHAGVCEKDGVPFLTFPILEGETWLTCGMSTRMGGVSEGDQASMNLGLTREENRENVVENFRRMCASLGVSMEKCVLSDQTHTDHIRLVTGADAGKGLLRPRDYSDVDGLMSDEPGLVMVTFFADCVPLILADPVHRAAASCHSGWKGTLQNIGGKAVAEMKKAFGTRPEDLLCVIGPSICQDCYEVDDALIGRFEEAYPDGASKGLWRAGREGHAQLNLQKCCLENFIRAGVPETRIELPDLCTCCNPDFLFSHRASGGRRGNLAVFVSVNGR